LSLDPHRHRTMANVSLLINLKKSRVQHLKHKQGECDYVSSAPKYEGWNFNSGNYLFTTDTK